MEVTAGIWTKLVSTGKLSAGTYMFVADISDRISTHYLRIANTISIDAIVVGGNVPYGSRHITTVAYIAEGIDLSIYVYLSANTTIASFEARLQAIRIK